MIIPGHVNFMRNTSNHNQAENSTQFKWISNADTKVFTSSSICYAIFNGHGIVEYVIQSCAFVQI